MAIDNIAEKCHKRLDPPLETLSLEEKLQRIAVRYCMQFILYIMSDLSFWIHHWPLVSWSLEMKLRTLLNDLEFPPILLASDWLRRHLLECTLEWVHRKRHLAVCSGFLFLATLDLLQWANKKAVVMNLTIFLKENTW